MPRVEADRQGRAVDMAINNGSIQADRKSHEVRNHRRFIMADVCSVMVQTTKRVDLNGA